MEVQWLPKLSLVLGVKQGTERVSDSFVCDALGQNVSLLVHEVGKKTDREIPSDHESEVNLRQYY